MTTTIEPNLDYLKLLFFKQHYKDFAKEAAAIKQPHLDFLAQLVQGETAAKQDRSIHRKIKLAKFPIIKTLDQFQWSWPKDVNQLQIQNLFHLNFIKDKANVVFLGTVGVGKTHLSIALAYTACLKGHSVLFTTAIEAVNSLATACATNRLKAELSRYLKPSLLILDELGYLPIDKAGADLLFQLLSQRYERGSTIITSNKPYKLWPEIFNNDSTLTSALLDRLLHHVETIQISGKSFRMKDKPSPLSTNN